VSGSAHPRSPATVVLAPVPRPPTPAPFSRARRATQVAFTLVFLALPFLALPFLASTSLTGTLVALKVGPLDLVEPSTAASAALASRSLPASLLVAALPLMLLALVLGPVYCSWACPFGLLSEALDAIRRRRGIEGWTGSPAAAVRRPRLLLLGLFLGTSLGVGIPLAALVAPPRLLTALPLEARAGGTLPVVTSTLLVLALLLDLLGPRRVICRVVCPAGAVASLLRRRWSLGPQLEASLCRRACPAPCLQTCPWGVDPRSMRPLDGCTTCLACVERCPSGALSAGLAQRNAGRKL
jgi:ferredoxin-type protein NapH